MTTSSHRPSSPTATEPSTSDTNATTITEDNAGTSLRHRWAVDVSAWAPSDEEFDWARSTLILDEEVAQVNKYRFPEDRKRALVSLVLQRTAGVTYARWRRMNSRTSSKEVVELDPLVDVELGKTKGRKPYIVKAASDEDPENTDNFNFNVSHDGKFVVLASELYCVCGCDVSWAGAVMGKSRKPSEGGPDESLDGLRRTLKSFQNQLTITEWEKVWEKGLAEGVEEVEAVSEDGHLGGGKGKTRGVAREFSKYWSLKEAYAKAIGMGLGYDLGRLEFEILESGRAEDVMSVAFVSIDGELSERWCCYVQRLRDDHWVSVARGPVDDVVDALGGFLGGFGVKDMGKDLVNTTVFQDLEPVFEELTFGDVVRMGYGTVVYETWAARFGGGR